MRVITPCRLSCGVPVRTRAQVTFSLPQERVPSLAKCILVLQKETRGVLSIQSPAQLHKVVILCSLKVCKIAPVNLPGLGGFEGEGNEAQKLLGCLLICSWEQGQLQAGACSGQKESASRACPAALLPGQAWPPWGCPESLLWGVCRLVASNP